MSDDFLEMKRTQAIAYFDMKRFEQAEPILKEILSLNPEDISAKYLLASSSYMLDKYDDAYQICNDIITTYLAVDVYRLLGKISRETKFYKNSEGFFLKSLELDPQDATTLAEYSYLLLLCGYKKKANEVMLEATTLEPDNSIVLHYKYYFQHTHGGKKDENEAIGQYIEASSDEVQKLIKLGLTDYKNNRFKSSKEYFRQAFLLEPTSEYILELLSSLDEINHFIFFPNRIFSKIHPVIRFMVIPLITFFIFIVLAALNSQLAIIFIISFYICAFLLIIWSWLSRPIYNHFIKKT